ncbi:cupin domain-containing protein [Mesobacterium sp. TK19101]|uniref:Cupin domain-containing protein n=1 Tax=Mesobacterium hydrothermale TaxID=3111907 RepID=A0ABU6HH40_9RHOB|nr:cupin domain-containing protein [Mesobacterium sp. TK19101]MEC3861782.1 cupin domain-containing protein [Mesobacterium sp. TK19101]
MPLPAFIRALPAADIPVPEDLVTTNAMQSEDGLIVFFTIHKDMEIPPHSHGPQWGMVIEGRFELTMNGETRVCTAGDSYDIPAGVEHGAKLTAGTILMDVFAEHDRYALRR